MEQLALTPTEFDELRRVIRAVTGIKLGDHKRSLVVARLSRRLRELGLSSFSDYLSLLRDGEEELGELVNAITTNTTQFFREPAHFDYLREWLPELRRQRERSRDRTLRVWSAACSTGQEPYTLAIVLAESFQGVPGWEVRLLASDIDTNVLRQASAGEYSEEALQGVSEARRRRFFVRDRDRRGAPIYRIHPALREMVLFRRVNLISDEFRFKRPVDIIFCRNALIYFDDQTRRRILQKFHRVLHQDGRIFVGHSESLLGGRNGFEYVKNTIYRREKPAQVGAAATE